MEFKVGDQVKLVIKEDDQEFAGEIVSSGLFGVWTGERIVICSQSDLEAANSEPPVELPPLGISVNDGVGLRERLG